MSGRADSDDTVAAAASVVGRVVSRVVTTAFVAGYLALWLGLAGVLLYRVARRYDVGVDDGGTDATPTSP
jgi:hypothetical protein